MNIHLQNAALGRPHFFLHSFQKCGLGKAVLPITETPELIHKPRQIRSYTELTERLQYKIYKTTPNKSDPQS